MCGIGVTVGCCCNDTFCNELLIRRGPDASRVEQVSPSVRVEATVLHMRGANMTPQPVKLSNESLFCWNGEVYQMKMEENGEEEEPLQHEHQEPDTTFAASDTQILANMLNKELEDNNKTFTLETISNVMSRVVNGEFAFCIVTKTSVFFARDAWGRRSLLVYYDSNNDTWRLSSVATDTSLDWKEVSPGCIYEYDIKTGETASLPFQTSSMPAIYAFDLPSPASCTMQRPCHVSESMWLASFQLQSLFTRAVHRRCSCYYNQKQEGVGVMFSGLDSVVLTALAAQVLPSNVPIDLLNVSFAGSKSADRQAALQSYQELQKLYPTRNFQLVLVEADWDDVVREETRIQQLMYPKTTTMDLNISTALWFASRGKGVVHSTDNHVAYESKCRILLLGMGADELMAGYGRHRKCFLEYGGYNRLRQELNMDLQRLWERNLGRDDRLISDHGKEARFPYLDTDVVNFVRSLPLQDVCDFEQEQGVGDKMILRLIAQRLGLETASGLVKRAIQFGTRIAHVSDKKRFGSRNKASGESHFRGAVGEEPNGNSG